MTMHRARLFALLAPLSLSACDVAPAPSTTGPANPDDATPLVVARAVDGIVANPVAAAAGADDRFVVRDVVVDADGREHVRFDRLYKGLPVLGGDFVTHSRPARGALDDVSLTLRAPVALDITPTFAEREAKARALGVQAAVDAGGVAGAANLVVWAHDGAPRLAFEVMVDGMQADGTPSELHVFVDAHDGAVLGSWDGIETGSAAGIGKGFFNGSVALTTNSIASGFELRDPSRGNQYTIDMKGKQGNSGAMFTDMDNTWGNFALTDNATVAVDAQYGTAQTWDYYLATHGRNGIGNDGKGAYNRVHYGRRYNNAFWSDSCFCMTYGDGDGTTFNPFDSLDVAGHEMSHGVTSRTANLVYSGESGGLNEATSDIFGASVEFFANNSNDVPDYLIGEELYKSGTKALRYMYRPSKDGASKDCWSSTLGKLDVHYSSGPANHFFYLLSEGSGVSAYTDAVGATTCNNSTVTGIGRAAAERIWYRALTVKFVSSMNYAGARAGTIAAANDLDPTGTWSAAVAAAWSAVGVN